MNKFSENKIWLEFAENEYEDKKKTYDNLLHKCEFIITFVSILITFTVFNSNHISVLKNIFNENVLSSYKIFLWIVFGVYLLMNFYLFKFFFNALKVTKSERIEEADFASLKNYEDISQNTYENEKYLYQHIIRCINSLSNVIDFKNRCFNKCLYDLFYFCILGLIFKLLCFFI